MSDRLPRPGDKRYGRAPANKTHNLSHSPEYRAWQNMIGRCEQPSSASFRWYGGRGIKVCPEWRASFERFFEYMGPKPEPSMSIDRIDTNGSYEPGNCRWATVIQQATNTRRCKRFYVDEKRALGWTIVDRSTDDVVGAYTSRNLARSACLLMNNEA